ncbi:hypothetical protein JCM10450v2_004626 [Rhodotorula kratochvilovae]
MAVAAMHAPRISWTQTDLAELDIEDLLGAWDDVGGWAAFAPVEDPPPSRSASPAPRQRLPRTSSLLQLAVEPLSPSKAALQTAAPFPDPRGRSASSGSSPVESPDPGFDFFQFPPIAPPSPPRPSSTPETLPKSTSADLISLDDIFGPSSNVARASPFPTTPLPPPSASLPSAPAARALASHFEANLPPLPAAARRPSIAPSSISIASSGGGSGSASFSGSGSSSSTARAAAARPLAMYPRPPPAPRGGAQQYPRPPPPPKEKRGRKREPSVGEGEGKKEPASGRREKKGWLSGGR